MRLVQTSVVAVLAFTLFQPTVAVCDDAKPADEHPIVTQVSSELGDRSPEKPLILVVEFKTKAGKGSQLIQAMRKAVPLTRQEEANVRYQLQRSPTDPTVFVLSEQWKSLNGLAAHLKTPYIEELSSKLDDILDGPPKLQVYTPIFIKASAP